MKRLGRVVGVNLALILFVLLGFELLFGGWIGFIRSHYLTGWVHPMLTYEATPAEITCQDEKTHHQACPSIVVDNVPDPHDEPGDVINYYDMSSVRVAEAKELNGFTDAGLYDVINLGDSFMQSRMIPFDKTLSAWMQRMTGLRVLQVGYSSWAPATEWAWLRQQKLKQGARLNLFLMMNDVTPHYSYANLWYHQTLALKDDPAGIVFPGRNSFSKSIPELSRTRKLYNELKRRWGPQPPPLVPYPLMSDVLSETQTSCGDLKKYENKALLTLDYVTFAFDSKCWDKPSRAQVESALTDVARIADYVAAAGGKLRVLIVPAGWSFEGETVEGKSAGDYRMAPSARITTRPFCDYVRRKLAPRNIETISLEDVILQMKRSDTQRFYTEIDGHWTVHAHELLGRWLAIHAAR